MATERTGTNVKDETRHDDKGNPRREKMQNPPSLEGEIEKRGGHATGEQLGDEGNRDERAPLAEQEKRNRGLEGTPTQPGVPHARNR